MRIAFLGDTRREHLGACWGSLTDTSSLSNPNTSAEAKAHAEEVLGGYTAKQPSAEDVKHEHRVLGGYKA